MRKSILTLLFAIMAGTFAFAQQTVASDFYLMKNETDAFRVLTVLNNELKLSEPEYAQVKSLLWASAESQAEQFKATPAPDAERTNIIKTRQTAHIENSLKSILGAKYSTYNNNKAAIETALKEAKKN
jgi:hypothetical protein